jgi:hypothetical protein
VRRHWHRLLTIAIVGSLLVAVHALAQTARAEDICHRNAPKTIDALRGYTWTGTVSDRQTVPFEDAGSYTVWVFAVDHVYADAHGPDFPTGQALQQGEPFRLASTCNGPTRFALGQRYIVSTSWLGPLGTSTNLFGAWRLDGQEATLVDMYEQGTEPSQLRDARSLEAVLRIVAPGALPPTDAPSLGHSAEPRIDAGVTYAILLLALALSGMFLLRLREPRT